MENIIKPLASIGDDRWFSQPSHAPLYKRPPYIYNDVEMFQILFTISPNIISKLLPHPLEPANRSRASCSFARYSSIEGLDPYNECFFLILAMYKKRPVTYCPFVWVDTDEALCAGREIWGFPKRLAQIEIELDGGEIHGQVSRRGIKIIDASVSLIERGKLQHILFEDIVVEKIIPNAEGDLSIRQLCRIRLQNYSLSDLRGGPAELSTAGSQYDQIDDLIPEQIIDGVYGRGRMVLPFGKLIEK
jgi:acetoacetate decarboxylase